MNPRIAVVLFNLGGPDSVATVKPFLVNLFSDPAIIRVPWPLRPILARLIAHRRAGVAERIYERLGGGSPLLANTQAQADALTAALGDAETLRVFIAMRYWRPRAVETAKAVARFAPHQVVLLPLYPQFSTTTTRSSVAEWQRAAHAAGLSTPSRLVCCYPDDPGFVAATAGHVRAALRDGGLEGRARVLFSAHGLPKRVVAGGDPYQAQVERTVAAVVAAVGVPALDWVVCYQSRVGPLEWIGPSTDDEIRRAGADRVPIVVCPIAFVSEHSETLVELDIEYRHLAEQAGVPRFVRVPTVGNDPLFIDGLARLVRDAMAREPGACSGAGHRLCPATMACAMASAA
ncbi:MAG TPA: ferrochelatase [Candidatus Sulfotelmatobacter sp.]|nr:ferrochelatase [Candidatus Sulfotelmatobacter sp.]